MDDRTDEPGSEVAPAQEPASVRSLFAPVGGRPNSCGLDEYLAFAVPVRTLAPCKLLVFGVGRDSSAWERTNTGGRTVFLESDADWQKNVAGDAPGLDVRSVDYTVPYGGWRGRNCAPGHDLLLELDDDITATQWDAVFVDAPFGPTTGRHQSVYTATQLVRAGGVVALHDCDRLREQVICEHLIEGQGFRPLCDVARLRVYKAPF